jgi:membrane protease YdiL (CAAX protease family)
VRGEAMANAKIQLITHRSQVQILSPLQMEHLVRDPFGKETKGSSSFLAAIWQQTSEARDSLIAAFFNGAWGWFAFLVVSVVFNTVLGEELLFRGLLPRMRAAFGRGDWVANGVLFTLYHLHQPWVMPATLVNGIFLEAYPTRRFQSAWMGIIVHSVQSVFVIAVVLVLVLK